MATNPLTAFLNGVSSSYSGRDPLREMALEQNVRQWNEGADQRQANVRLTEAQATQAEVEAHEMQRQQALRSFGEAELRANELGGMTQALGDPVFKQRLVRSVNLLSQAEGSNNGYEVIDYERMNSRNAQQWGMGADVYEEVLTNRNPQHVRGSDDDEVLVPIFRHPDGTVGPADTSGDGEIEAYSAQEVVNQIRGRFVGSDEYASALGSLYGGQPGGQTGGGGQPGMQAQAPAQPQAPQQQSPTQAISPDAMVSAGQVAQGSQPSQGGQVEAEVVSPQRTLRNLRREREALQEQQTPEAQSRLAEIDAEIEETESFEALWAKYDKDDEVGRVARSVPRQPGESGETSLGVPRDQVASDASRAIRRVAEGKGISPAQAKELAVNPEGMPQPTPRAAAAAGARFLQGLEPESEGSGGEGQSADIGGSAGGFRVSGGRKPSHKQLTTAVILNRAGILDSESLTRFADLGVISQDGVSVIQTGMQQSAQTQRQAMTNATSLQQTRMQQQGMMERTVVDRMMQQNDPNNRPSFSDIQEENMNIAQTFYQAQGADPEVAEQNASQVASIASYLGSDSAAFRDTDWSNPRTIENIDKLMKADRAYNDTTLLSGSVRWLQDRPSRLNLSRNPMAVMLMNEGSGVMEDYTRDPTFWEGVGSWLVDSTDITGAQRAAVESFQEKPRFLELVEDPMFSTANELGMRDTVQRNPDFQKRIYDIAAAELKAEADRSGDSSILNDDDTIREAIIESTRAVINSTRSRSQ